MIKSEPAYFIILFSSKFYVLISHSHASLPGKKYLRIYNKASLRGAWLQQAASHCFLCFIWKSMLYLEGWTILQYCQFSTVFHGQHSKPN